MLEEIKELLKPALLERVDLPLIMLLFMSMFMLEGFWTIVEYKVLADEKRRCLFATSLMSATIQDGGKRQRSMWSYCNSTGAMNYYIKILLIHTHS